MGPGASPADSTSGIQLVVREFKVTFLRKLQITRDNGLLAPDGQSHDTYNLKCKELSHQQEPR